jgi:hypothetical protein
MPKALGVLGEFMNEDAKNKVHPILYVLTVLVAVNLAVSTAQLFSDNSNLPAPPAQIDSLPDYLTSSEIENLKDKILALYNNRDIEGLYEEMDPAVRVQITLEDFQETFLRIYDLAGGIGDAAYVSFEKTPSKGQQTTYVLNFTVRVTDSEFSTGEMKISIYDRGDHYGFVGFFLNPQFLSGGS